MTPERQRILKLVRKILARGYSVKFRDLESLPLSDRCSARTEPTLRNVIVATRWSDSAIGVALKHELRHILNPALNWLPPTEEERLAEMACGGSDHVELDGFVFGRRRTG